MTRGVAHNPSTTRGTRRPQAVVLVGVLGFLASLLAPGTAHATNDPKASYTFLADPFTQELYGQSDVLPAGIVFAANGDLLTCLDGGRRFSASSTSVVHGSTVHTRTALVGSGCDGIGITNHPDGFVYNNSPAGVRRLDPNNNLAVVSGPYGFPGSNFGIATDPQTGNLVYVASDQSTHWVNSTFTAQGVFSTNSQGHSIIDQIAFDPTGNFLFLAGWGDATLIILRRDGSLVRVVPAQPSPDGIAFHASTPKFVAVSNTDGTLSRFDFPNDDYSAPPTHTLMGSGAGYGDHTIVGPDGCWYVSNLATRYADGTAAGNGIVRICGGFAPTAGVTTTAVTVTAPSPSKVYGAAVPPLTPTYGGLTGGDTQPATAATCITTATATSPAGTYPVTCSGASDPKYTFAYVAGTLTISKASPTISTQASSGGPLGTTLTDTATVAGGLNPTGTVTFRLFGNSSCTTQVFTSTNPVSAGTATSGAFPPASPGTYYWTALYNGDANHNTATSPCNAPNESAVITPPACTSTLTGTVTGPVVVNAGQSVCVENARVAGQIAVNPGGLLTVTASQVAGGIVATSPAYVRLCGAQVVAPTTNLTQGVVVQSAAVPFTIGDAAASCAQNRVTGDIRLLGNTGGFTLGNNIVSRNTTVEGNTGSTIIKGNQVFGTLACSGNNPGPTNAGQLNSAPTKTGQCSGL
jgi:hypothetical protein